MKTTAVILAAGVGSRMGTLKQLINLDGKPVLAHTIKAFEDHEEVDEIVLVAPKNVEEAILPYGFKKVKNVVKGGSHRQASVWLGLMALSPYTSLVLIHDGARPLVSHQNISDVLDYVRRGLCAVLGVKSKDTVKITDENNIIKDTPLRDRAWLVQTPQGFPLHLIREAHQQAIDKGFVGTDDATLVEHMGISVYMVEGSYRNIKLTTPEDVEVAESLLSVPSGIKC